MYTFIPKKLFLTKGIGTCNAQLSSFEMALRDAGIANLNLVTVSSICPPHCEVISRESVPKDALPPGSICFTVMSKCSTNEPGRIISASIGLARPVDNSHWGYLSEYHSYGKLAGEAGEYAEDLAATMLASTLGVEFDPDADYNERKEIYEMSGKVITSTEITTAAQGASKKGVWTTVVAAAVFLFE